MMRGSILYFVSCANHSDAVKLMCEAVSELGIGADVEDLIV